MKLKILMTLISLVSVATLAHAQGYIITQGAAANITTNTGTFGNTAIAPNHKGCWLWLHLSPVKQAR